MKIECPSCQTRLKMDDAKIPEQGIKAKCPNCGALIHVKRPAPADTPPPRPPAMEARPPLPPTEMPPPIPSDYVEPLPRRPAAPGGQNDKVPDRLLVSILVTVFLCLPLGVVAILFAARARSQKAAGNYDKARSSAKIAGILCLVSLIVPIIGIVAAIAIPQFVSFRQKSMNAASMAALSNLKVAQDAYYFEHNAYAARFGDLEEWFELEPEVIMQILAADEDSWSGWARHQASDDRFVYSSSEGGAPQLE